MSSRAEQETPSGRASAGRPPTSIDVVRLYGSFQPRLERMVGDSVGAPDAVIEDACQFAWLAFLRCRTRLEMTSAPGWLLRTAIHEALRLVRAEDREESLEWELQERPDLPGVATDPGPEDRVCGRQRIQDVGRLPVRQQRLVWLVALGLSHEEMALHEHCTSRTVRRQLERARRALRAAEGDSVRAAA